MPNGIASHDTFSRLFAALDPKQLDTCAGRWMAAVKAGIEANRYLVRYLPWIGDDLPLRPDRQPYKAAYNLRGEWIVVGPLIYNVR